MAKVLIYKKPRTKKIKKQSRSKVQWASKEKGTNTWWSDCKTCRKLATEQTDEISVTVRFIPGVTTNAMQRHLKGSLDDYSPGNIVLHHGTNNLERDYNSEKLARDIVNLGSWYISQVWL